MTLNGHDPSSQHESAFSDPPAHIDHMPLSDLPYSPYTSAVNQGLGQNGLEDEGSYPDPGTAGAVSSYALLNGIPIDNEGYPQSYPASQDLFDARGAPSASAYEQLALAQQQEDSEFSTSQQSDDDADVNFDDGSDDEDFLEVLGMSPERHIVDDSERESGPAGGRGRPRGRPRGRGRGRGRSGRHGGWRQFLKGTEHENVGRTQIKRGGITRAHGGNMQGRGRKPRIADPGKQFRERLAEANQYFVSGDLEAAADFARQAVQINPEIFQAHSLLSEILKLQGRDEDSVEALILGAMTVRNPAVWNTVCDKVLEMGGDDPSDHMLRRAMICVSTALKLKSRLDPVLDYDLRVKKFELYMALDDMKGARQDCKNILRIWPGDLRFLREYAQLTAAWQEREELVRAKNAYDAAFEIYKDQQAFGDDIEEAWSHVNIYLELVDLIGIPEEGIAQSKRLARWTLGRKDESFWDECQEDDREFDVENTRREEVNAFSQGMGVGDSARYGAGLPIELRVRLGLFRLKLGPDHHAEALQHFDHLLEFEPYLEDYFDLFLQAARGVTDADIPDASLNFYEGLRALPEVLAEKDWMALANCYRSAQQQDDAMQCLEETINFRGEFFAEASALLATLYEEAGETTKAKILFNELIQMDRDDLLTQDQLLTMREEIQMRSEERLRLRSAQTKGRSRAAKRLRSVSPLRDFFIHHHVKGGVFTEFVDAEEFERKRVAGHTKQQWHQYRPEESLESAQKRKKKGPAATVEERPPTDSTDDGDDDFVDDGDHTDDEDDHADPPLPPTPKRARLESAFRTKPTTITSDRMQHIRPLHARVDTHYATLLTHWPAFLAGTSQHAEQQWVIAATHLLGEFSSMRTFFPALTKTTAPQYDVALNYHPTIATTHAIAMFQAIPIPEWHHILSDLTLYYVRCASQTQCQQLLNIIFAAYPFTCDPALDMATYGLAFHCALRFNNGPMAVDLVRKLITRGDQRAGGPVQLFAAVARLMYTTHWFNAGPTQKFFLRLVKTQDYIAFPEEIRSKIDWSTQETALAARRARTYENDNQDHSEANPSSPSSPSSTAIHLQPPTLLVYGHMVAINNFSHSSLPYYYRALALRPDDPVILLSIATMWIQNAMKRQADNRHASIMQGRAFLERYAAVRLRAAGTSPANGDAPAHTPADNTPHIYAQEVAFNTARFWHHLGLTHLAITGYERVLAMSAAAQEDPLLRDHPSMSQDGASCQQGEDFAFEAAFALRSIFTVVGNIGAALAITERWLVL